MTNPDDQSVETRPGREPMFNLPPAIAAIAGVLIGIHLLRVFILPIGAGEAVIDMFGFVPAQVWSAPAEGVHGIAAWVMRLVPFLSYSLLHGDFLHLTFNTVWLVALGTPVERYLGTIRFCVFAALGAVVSAAFYGALNPTSDVPMIGASGAVSAMMGALLRLMFALRQRDGVARLVDPGLLSFAVIWIAFNVVTGIGGIGFGREVQSIAWEAHIGGFLTGLLFSPLFDRHSGAHDLARRLRGAKRDG